MEARAIALAIPFFFSLIGLEAFFARKRKFYSLHDAINSLSCGVGQQVIYLFTTAFSIAAYVYLESHFALMKWSIKSPLAWVVLLLLVDHSYYWFHRASHRVSFLWAGHAVHHQSEEYNLTTALRQSWIEASMAWPFYLPIALLGFPPVMFVLASTFNSLYQFGIHTRTIDKVRPVEGVLNTPSSHRVHHGIDPEYIDKNYGGMLMLWDRAFGTYQPETHAPTFGTVKPLASWNPLWANLEGWAKIVSIARRTSRLRDKVWAFFAPPEWLPADLGGVQTVPPVDHAAYRKFDVEASPAVDRWVVLQFAIVALASTALLWSFGTWPRWLSASVAGWILVSLVAWGGLMERRRWGLPLEAARLLAGIALAIVAFTRMA